MDYKKPVDNFDKVLRVHRPLIKTTAYQIIKLMRYNHNQSVSYRDAYSMATQAAWSAWKTQTKAAKISGRSPFTFATYLYRWAKFVINNYDHDKEFISPISLDSPTDTHEVRLPPESRDECDPIEDMMNKEALRVYLNRLDPLHKQIIELRFYHDRTLGEVAKELDISPESVRLIQNTAINRLHCYFTEE